VRNPLLPRTYKTGPRYTCFDKAPAEPITLKKVGAAMSAAGEELRLCGRKMAFGARPDQQGPVMVSFARTD
jgi:hypothetical protein